MLRKMLTNGIRVFVHGKTKKYQLIRNGMVTELQIEKGHVPWKPGLYDLAGNYLGPEGPDGGLLISKPSRSKRTKRCDICRNATTRCWGPCALRDVAAQLRAFTEREREHVDHA